MNLCFSVRLPRGLAATGGTQCLADCQITSAAEDASTGTTERNRVHLAPILFFSLVSPFFRVAVLATRVARNVEAAYDDVSQKRMGLHRSEERETGRSTFAPAKLRKSIEIRKSHLFCSFPSLSTPRSPPRYPETTPRIVSRDLKLIQVR